MQEVLLPSLALHYKQSMVILALRDGDRRIRSSKSRSGTLEASLDYMRPCPPAPQKKWIEKKGEEKVKEEKSGVRHQSEY